VIAGPWMAPLPVFAKCQPAQLANRPAFARRELAKTE
jgi:hypothetical protein